MQSYPQLFTRVAESGDPVESRLGLSFERVGESCFAPIVALPYRHQMAKALGYMEVLQLIAGVFDLGAIQRVAPRARLELFTEAAAYGPRVLFNGIDQLQDVVDELTRFPLSRRAVIMMPKRAERMDTRPCTTSLQFILRQDAVMCVATMRSWDLWMGAPYDLMMFSALTQIVAQLIGASAFGIKVMVGSAHIYQEHSLKMPGDRTWMFILPRFSNLEEYRRWAMFLVSTWTGQGTPAMIFESIQEAEVAASSFTTALTAIQ